MSAIAMVRAAQTAPPSFAKTAAKMVCHEAVLGWLLTAEGVKDPWHLVEEIRAKVQLAIDAREKLHVAHYKSIVSIPGPFFYDNVYRPHSAQLTLGSVHELAKPGDILFTGRRQLSHSMVVVHNGGQWDVKIRGFNNYGTFGPKAPLEAYDRVDRDVAVAFMWTAGNLFGGHMSREPMYRVSYDVAARNSRLLLTFLKSN